MEDIAPCTACMTCFDRVEHLLSPRCRINAALGREREYQIKPAGKRKRVMIVGGGPAGMEAARVTASRGHDVMLYEKMGKLGGSMLVAATVKGVEKEDLMAMIRYLETQITKLGVQVHLGKKITESLIDEVKPDALILATGAIHDIPSIPGMNGRNVTTSEKLHHQVKLALKFAGPKLLRWLTKLYMPVGKNVVILGARLHGCQTAEFLVKRGRTVTVLDTCKYEEIGEGLLETFMKPWLLLWLDEKGVNIIPEVQYERITRKGIIITTKDGVKQTIQADSIITAMPLKPNTGLLDRMKKKVKEVYAIGDTREPGYIVDAVADGSRIAREI
jgi:2,4-dienoyl-CoA reductase (NADPH2)